MLSDTVTEEELEMAVGWYEAASLVNPDKTSLELMAFDWNREDESPEEFKTWPSN